MVLFLPCTMWIQVQWNCWLWLHRIGVQADRQGSGRVVFPYHSTYEGGNLGVKGHSDTSFSLRAQMCLSKRRDEIIWIAHGSNIFISILFSSKNLEASTLLESISNPLYRRPGEVRNQKNVRSSTPRPLRRLLSSPKEGAKERKGSKISPNRLGTPPTLDPALVDIQSNWLICVGTLPTTKGLCS